MEENLATTICLKILRKIRKPAKESKHMLQQAYGDSLLSMPMFYHWLQCVLRWSRKWVFWVCQCSTTGTMCFEMVEKVYLNCGKNDLVQITTKFIWNMVAMIIREDRRITVRELAHPAFMSLNVFKNCLNLTLDP